jgi:hypothetical protein
MRAGCAMALLCAAGHALAGRGMFYRPIRSTIASDLHAGVFTGMWHVRAENLIRVDDVMESPKLAE